MYLVKDRRFGMDNYVFTRTDPRSEGFEGDVVEGVALDYDMNAIHQWSDGQPQPNPCLGRDPGNPKQFKVFKSPEDLAATKFEFLHSNTPFVLYSWTEYRNRFYPVPEEFAKSMSSDEWFDYLEEADSAARVRKTMSAPNKPTPGDNWDQVAKWVAKRHMGADGGIREIWFLQAGSPKDEIRLLEVSERFTGAAAKVEPVDFGLDVEGAKYKLLVADVSTEQLDNIKADPTHALPNDWRIENTLVWNRRELQ